LDLGPFSTSGLLTTSPELPISPGTKNERSNIYKLCSVVVHAGSHDFGHFVTVRREPGGVQSEGKSWYHISDENVGVVKEEEATRVNPFLVFFERVEGGDYFSNEIVEKVEGRVWLSWEIDRN
jgi:ubiquitin carboxyl-terminal hydrolase 1